VGDGAKWRTLEVSGGRRRQVVDVEAENWVAEVNDGLWRHVLYAEAELWGAEVIGKC